MMRFMQQIITGVSSLAVALSPILATPSFGQGISGTGSSAPEVLRSANNTPLVMISTPNGAGVSHNTYGSFDIDGRGAILNNIDANYGQTQLGGYVQGNANLRNGAASVIINEVVANNPSDLNGYLEVGGTRADVVIANPYGITCDGCGFINTDHATITTGVPGLGPDGALNSIDVTRGHVVIGERGLDATGVSQFDLLSRTVKFAGAIYGQQVRVVAGRNNVIYATGKVEVKGDDGGEAPAIAIDSTVLGGMYANKITINSTERGVGVRAPATMAANAGEMHITADGRLVMGQASARRVTVRSRNSDVEIKRQIAAAEQAEIQAARDLVIAANGRLVSSSVLDLKAGRDVVLHDGAAAGSEQAGVRVVAGRSTGLGAGAQLIAAQDLNLQSNEIRLGSKSLVAAGGIGTITSETLALNGGTLQATHDLSLASGAVDINSGVIQSGHHLTLTAQSLSGQDHDIFATGMLKLDAGRVSLGDGQIVADGDVTLRADDLAIAGLIGSREGALDIATRTGDLAATGNLVAGKNIRLASVGRTDLGYVQAGDALTIASAGDVTGRDAFTSLGLMEITTGGSLNGLALHAGTDIVTKAAGDILIGDDPLMAGGVLPHQEVDAPEGGGPAPEPADPGADPDAGTDESDPAAPNIVDPGEDFTITPGLRIGDVRAGQDIDLNAGGRIVIGNSAVAGDEIKLDAGKLIDINAMQLGGSLAMQSGTGDSRIGTLIVAGDFALKVNGRLALGQVAAPGSLTLSAGALALGSAAAGKTLTLTSDTGDLDFTGTANAAEITMTAAQNAAISGQLMSSGAIRLEAISGDLIHRAGVITPEMLSLLAAGKVTDSGRGALPEDAAKGTAALGALTITGGSVQSSGNYLIAGAANISATTGDVSLNGRLVSGDLTVSAATGLSNSGTLTSHDLVLDAKGQGLTNSGKITAWNTLHLAARGEIRNQSGGDISGHYGATEITAASLKNDGTITLIDARLDLGGDLRNSGTLSANTNGSIGGTLMNTGEIAGGQHSLTLAGLSNSGNFRTDGRITLTMSGDIRNSGILHGRQGVSVAHAGAITNTAGGEISGDVLSVQAQSLNNAGQIIAGVTQIEVSDNLTNSGLIQNGAATNEQGETIASRISAATITNSGDIINDQGALIITARSSFASTGQLSGRGEGSYLEIRANALPEVGKVAADGYLMLSNASGGLLSGLKVERGEKLVTKGALHIKAATVTNAGGIAGLGGLILEGNSLKNTGTIYSGADMALLFRDLIDNDGGLIMAVNGGLAVSGRERKANGEYKALTRLVNQDGGVIQSDGDMRMSAIRFENIATAPEIETDVEETSEFHRYGRCGGSKHDCTERTTTTKVATERIVSKGDQAQIIAGGDIHLNGHEGFNKWSLIYSQNDIFLSFDSMVNEGRNLTRTTEVRRDFMNDYDDSAFSGGHRTYWTEVDPIVTEKIELVASTIHANGTVYGKFTDYLTNETGTPAVDPDYKPLLPGNIKKVSRGGPLIGGGADVPASMLSFTPDAVDLNTQAGQVTGPDAPSLSAGGFVNLGVIGNDNLFVVNQDPQAKYLVETRHKFIDQRSFLSSDYFLDTLGFDPEGTQMRLGDGMVETSLIRDQLFAQTGRNLLVGYGSEYDQLRAMYDNAAAQAQALDLVPGVALTASQVDALTSDIVWLEEHVVSGRKVLIPRVYLTEDTIRNNAKGAAQIVGDRGVKLNTGKLINKGGAIGSTHGQTVIASGGDIQNDYGLIFGGNNGAPDAQGLKLPSVVLSAEGNYTSTSGSVTGKDVVIAATDIILKTEIRQSKVGTSFADGTGNIAGIRAQNSITLDARRDIALTGARLDAGDDVTVLAGGDITLEALALKHQAGEIKGDNYYFERGTKNLTSDITAGGDVMLISTGANPGDDGGTNITLAGSDVDAGGTVGIAARNGSVSLTSVEDEFYSARASKSSSMGGLSKSSSGDQVYDLSNNTVSLSGESIDIYADGNVLAQGTQFTANGLTGEDAVESGNLRITSARGNIDFIAVEDIHAEKHEKSSKILGGLISKDSTREDVRSDMRGATVTTTGDLDLSAAQGSVLFQGGDYTGVAGNVHFDTQKVFLQGTIDTAYSFEHVNDNNGVIITDKTEVAVDETADMSRFRQGSVDDLLASDGPAVHRGGRGDGATSDAQYVRGRKIEASGPQGILPYAADKISSGEEVVADSSAEVQADKKTGAEPHWTVSYVSQYDGNASLNTITDADITGPGTEYLAALAADKTGRVTYGTEVQILDVQYKEVTRQAGVLTKLAISLITQNPWAAFAVNTAVDGVISGELDFEKIVKDAAFTALTAGFDLGGGVEFKGVSGFAKDTLKISPLYIDGERVAGYFSETWVQNATIDAFSSATVQTAVYGGSFRENLKQSAGNELISEVTAFGQNEVGDIKGKDGSLIGVTGHGIVGCVSADLSGGNCARGAVNAAAAELVTGFVDRQTGDKDKTALVVGTYINPILAALTSGGDVSQFGINQGISESQLTNNYLMHGDVAEAKRMFAACTGTTEQCIQQALDFLREASLTNDIALMQECGNDAQCIRDRLLGDNNLFVSNTPTSMITRNELRQTLEGVNPELSRVVLDENLDHVAPNVIKPFIDSPKFSQGFDRCISDGGVGQGVCVEEGLSRETDEALKILDGLTAVNPTAYIIDAFIDCEKTGSCEEARQAAIEMATDQGRRLSTIQLDNIIKLVRRGDYSELNDSIGAARPILPDGYKWVRDTDGNAAIRDRDGNITADREAIDRVVTGDVGNAAKGGTNPVSLPLDIKTWNEFQSATSGQFVSRADAAKGWNLYKQAHDIQNGTQRSQAAKSFFLKQLGASGKAPKWMNQYLSKGKVPSGYQVDHQTALSAGGADTPLNMRLKDIETHKVRHKYYRPWE